jgi:hypothetical protein
MSVLVSCDKPTKPTLATPNTYLPFTLGEVEGNATMDTHRFTIVFEGEEYETRRSGELHVGGYSDPTEVSVGELTGRYEGGSLTSNGVCTVTFRSHAIKLMDEGKRLSIQGNDVDVYPTKKIIIAKKDREIEFKDN